MCAEHRVDAYARVSLFLASYRARAAHRLTSSVACHRVVSVGAAIAATAASPQLADVADRSPCSVDVCGLVKREDAGPDHEIVDGALGRVVVQSAEAQGNR